MKKKNKRSKLPLLLVTPTFILLASFTFYPFLRAIYLSFFVTDKVGNPGAFVGIDNYKRVFSSALFKNSVLTTLKYTTLIGVFTFLLAMILAYLCVDRRPGSGIYQTMFSLPMALASTAIALIADYIFGKYGLVNGLFGTTNSWITDKQFTLGTLVIIVVWAHCGSSFIYLLVGFRNVPEDVVECAELDGATGLTKFFRIYLPIASPQVSFVIFWNILQAFKSFGVIKILLPDSNNSLDVLVLEVYKQAFIRGRFETACVYALVLCAFIFLFTWVQQYFERKLVFYQ